MCSTGRPIVVNICACVHCVAGGSLYIGSKLLLINFIDTDIVKVALG